jgi:hypothetical protein
MLGERRLVNWGLRWPALTADAASETGAFGAGLAQGSGVTRQNQRTTDELPGGPRPVRAWRMPTMVRFADVCGPIFAASRCAPIFAARRQADGRPRSLQGGQYGEGGIRTLVPGDPDNRFSRPGRDILEVANLQGVPVGVGGAGSCVGKRRSGVPSARYDPHVTTVVPT